MYNINNINNKTVSFIINSRE